MAGDILAIGLEDNQLKTRSEVQFWNVADPARPVALEHLTIRRSGIPKDKTAGAIALAPQGGRHLVAVANWDSRAVDFYRAGGKPLDDAGCRFEPIVRWQAATADTSAWIPDHAFGTYQSINFVADASGRLFLVGFDTTPAGQDVVDLFGVDFEQPPAKLLRKLARKPIQLSRDNHFRYAGGLTIHAGRLTIFASPRNLATETWLNMAR